MNSEIVSELAAKEGKKEMKEAVATKEIEEEGEEEKKRRAAKRKNKKDKAQQAQEKEKQKEADKKAAEKGQTRRASYILIKYMDDNCPDKARHSSWRDPNGEIITQRTKENAVAILKDLRGKVISKTASFAELSMEHSDCTSAKKGGDLGIFVSQDYHQVDMRFVQTLFTLDVGQMSEVILNRSGAYIMMRTE